MRDIVTDELTDISSKELTTSKERKKVKKHILHRIEKETDVEVGDVLFTDVAVQ